MSDRDTITLPREVVQEALEALIEARALLYDGRKQDKAATALRTALAAEPTKPEDADAIIDAGKKKHEAKQEPVAAQHRFRRPEKSAPDWGPWHACKVSNRPAWEIDSQGWLAEYRPLYTVPPDAKALRRDAERYRWGVENARWVRHEHEAYVAIPVAVDADLSCTPMRTAAIDAAMKEDKP